MNQNARFIVLLVIVLLVIGGLWYAIFGGKTEQPTDTRIASTSTAKKDERRELADAPDITSTRKPSQLSPTASRSRNDSGTRKAARTGTSAIRGQVMLEEGDIPVADAEIRLIWQDRDAMVRVYDKDSQWTTTSDARGFFRFDKLPSGNYTLFARKDDLGGVGGAYVNPREPEDHIADIKLGPVSAISGVVVNEAQEPIADAIVGLGPGKLNGQDIYSDSQTRTDGDGHFTLDFIRKGTWLIEAKADGYAVGEAVDVAHDANDVKIVLGPGGKIRGTVVSAETTKPQANVTVRLRGNYRGRLNGHEVTTDAEGRFEVPNLADGTYTLAIDKQPHILVGEQPQLQISEANTIDNVQLVVALGGSVSGVATDAETGAPIVGMAFRPRSPNGGYAGAEAVTDEDGVYRIEGLPAGQYTIRRLWMSGYRHGESREDKQVTVALGQEVTGIDFAVPPGLYLRGRVVDKSGEPLASVEVQSIDSQNMEGETMYTDEKGRFVHRGFSPGAKLTITANKAGFAAEPLTNVVIGDTDKNDVEIVMDTGGSIAGVVVDKNGEPLVDAYVMAVSPNGNDQQSRSASSGQEGVFKLQGLTAGRYKLTVRPPRTWREPVGTNQEVQVSQGEHVTGVRLVCEFDAGMKLAGRVIDSAGKPVRDAHVNAHMRNGNSSGFAQTDAEGQFEIIGLQPGTHWYGAYHENYSQPTQQQEVEVPNTNMTITLRGKGTIQGRVLEAQSGQPVKTFSIVALAGRVERLDPSGFYGNNGQTFVDEEGKFEIRGNDGDASLYVMAQGYAPKVHYVAGVHEGQTTSGVDIRLDAGAIIEGMVKDKQGQPVSGASIYIGRPPMQEWERQQRTPNATSESDGSFVIESLAGDETRVFAVHGGYATANAVATPGVGGTATVTIILGSGGTVEGTIRVSGRPASSGYGVTLNMSEGEGQGYHTQTEVDGSGHFRFEGLPEGTAHLTVYGSQPGVGRRNISRQASVVPDQVTVVDFDIIEGTAGIEGVITREGVPAANAMVNVMIRASETEQESAHAQADSKGAYRFENLPPGPATLMVHLNIEGQSSQARSFTVELEDRRTIQYDIDLAAGKRIRGRVNGIQQNWFASVSVFRGSVDISGDIQQLWQNLQSAMVGAAQVTPEGTFEIEGIEPGQYTVLVIGMDPQSGGQTYKKTSHTVNVSEDDVSVELTLE